MNRQSMVKRSFTSRLSTAFCGSGDETKLDQPTVCSELGFLSQLVDVQGEEASLRRRKLHVTVIWPLPRKGCIAETLTLGMLRTKIGLKY